MTYEVEVAGGRVETFANLASARSYRDKWGGTIRDAANAQPIESVASTDNMPVISPYLCTLLGLSTVALSEPAEVRAAWHGNGEKSAPQDADKIRQALVGYWRVRRSCDTDEAVKFLKERHPLIFPDKLYEARTGVSANERTVEGLLFSNQRSYASLSQQAGLRWVNLAPYGQWPHEKGLQVFTRDDAANVVQRFDSSENQGEKMLGLPWFEGHPDAKEFQGRDTKTSAVGRIKKLEAREDGLWAGVKFNREGEQLIADEAFHGHSVNWWMKPDPNRRGAYRPVALKSVGFTNSPNLPVTPVTTANEV